MLDDPSGRLFVQAEIFPLRCAILDVLDLLKILFDSGQLSEDGMFLSIDAVES